MRLIQRLAISGLLSVVLIVLLTGTFVTRRDLDSVIERGSGIDEHNNQLNTAWVQENDIPDQDHQKIEIKDRRPVVNPRHRPVEISSTGSISPKVYEINEPEPPLDSVTNQRRDKIKEVCLSILF